MQCEKMCGKNIFHMKYARYAKNVNVVVGIEIRAFQFNNLLLVCQSVSMGIKQNYRIKANMPLDGMQVSVVLFGIC